MLPHRWQVLPLAFEEALASLKAAIKSTTFQALTDHLTTDQISILLSGPGSLASVLSLERTSAFWLRSRELVVLLDLLFLVIAKILKVVANRE